MSSKLLEDRQAEMRERMLQETANRKRHQFALEPKDISFGWDTGQTNLSLNQNHLKNARRVGDRKTSERQYNCQPR